MSDFPSDTKNLNSKLKALAKSAKNPKALKKSQKFVTPAPQEIKEIYECATPFLDNNKLK